MRNKNRAPWRPNWADVPPTLEEYKRNAHRLRRNITDDPVWPRDEPRPDPWEFVDALSVEDEDAIDHHVAGVPIASGSDLGDVADYVEAEVSA